MTNNEKELLKSFKVEELEQRLEMKIWSGGGSEPCTWTSETTGISYPDSDCNGDPDFAQES